MRRAMTKAMTDYREAVGMAKERVFSTGEEQELGGADGKEEKGLS